MIHIIHVRRSIAMDGQQPLLVHAKTRIDHISVSAMTTKLAISTSYNDVNPKEMFDSTPEKMCIDYL
jgi:hypothetical protein